MPRRQYERIISTPPEMDGLPHGVTGYKFELSAEGLVITQYLSGSSSIVIKLPPSVHVELVEFEEATMDKLGE